MMEAGEEVVEAGEAGAVAVAGAAVAVAEAGAVAVVVAAVEAVEAMDAATDLHVWRADPFCRPAQEEVLSTQA